MKNFNSTVIAPASTYRIQLHKGFTLKDLEARIDYLDELGVSGIYAAPLFKATPGSIHGYDVTDPHVINPEIGDLNDLKRISSKLKDKKMLWIQDIVPNHMAFNDQNYRLMDVLQRGKLSEFSTYFDINWNHPSPDLNGKLMVPFLGKSLEECIEGREIQLVLTESGLKIKYYDNFYPLSVSAYAYLLHESRGLTPDLEGLQKRIEKTQTKMSFDVWTDFRRQWLQHVFSSDENKGLLEDVLSIINQDPIKLRYLLDQQYYTLTHWKRTETEINYRRFFTINDLICLRMEDERVFTEYHSFLHDLYEQNIIDGLRIDHIDGLNDPNGYLKRLRKLFGDECYIITEKILESKEEMPAHWPVQGESGYQFLAFVSQLLTNMQGANELLDFYNNLVPGTPDYEQLVLANKQRILKEYMGGEWDNLVHCFFDLGLQKDYSYEKIKDALAAIMICLPVYRVYPEKLPVTGISQTIFQETFDKAFEVFPDSIDELKYLNRLFTATQDAESSNAHAFLNRLMQFTGPLTAKGVEDTTFYVYNPMISHCEVGDSPSERGIAAKDFHDRMARRIKSMPLSLNATATHDTKRGEDARIRLNVLSELPGEWEKRVNEWMEVNSPFRNEEDSGFAPSINDEYFIYQSIVGGFPEDLQVTKEFVERLQAYVIKVVREAKVKSNWEAPNEAYESACTGFVEKILNKEHGFLSRLMPFMEKILDYSREYSLAQVLLKITVPGTPDIYQGCELWDLSFVDPDNRRPVDYDKRVRYLSEVKQKEKEGKDALFSYLSSNKDKGMEKLYVTWKVLNFRREHPKLFTDGSYQPLLTTRKGVVTAYIRQYEKICILVAIPIGLSLYNASAKHLETEILIPEGAKKGEWKNLFTGKNHKAASRISVKEVFEGFSLAVLVNK